MQIVSLGRYHCQPNPRHHDLQLHPRGTSRSDELRGTRVAEPFDFLTWFEFAPGDAAGFEELVQQLRATEEWSYVEREIDLRLARN